MLSVACWLLLQLYMPDMLDLKKKEEKEKSVIMVQSPENTFISAV